MKDILRVATAAVVAAVLTTAAGCSGAGSTPDAGPVGTSSPGSASPGSSGPSHSATARPTKHFPTGPPMQLQSIAPVSGATVGVAMPISMIFTDPVAPSARQQLEEHIDLTTSPAVTGAWHWFSPRRVDFRPKTYWTPGTTVSMVARFDHVGDGNGRYGTHSYTRRFTIGDDVRTHVFVQQHKTVVTRDGKVLRTMPSDAGSPDWPSWDGTMAVVNKSRTVRMTSCSVGIACKKNDPNFYDITLPWDVRITWSGTFLHYSTGDPHPGHSFGSHGCVHLSYADAKWYYDLSKEGDPVTVTGSRRGNASGDNGYADYNLSWDQWLHDSAAKQVTTRS
ncbi:L,D-transpeptidase [Nocardioides sp. CER19]|uniref:L,D-transpeptidase n=1 Tax=Nocardioides sp. CER19 TaxID=3038538 RepID=UPI00244CE1BD|nr:L,D-transpeptidase [Nocardioides sp. CER19]MDH2415601.1 L,D-transpeptidase [Nocardioides sp. CER19]